MPIKLPFFTLLLLISFASVNAVLFTPALPNITHFFGIAESSAQLTITWFLIGYALGQLLYGPLANRFGRKKALFAGIGLQIFSSLLCVFSGSIHSFGLLVLGRFFLALGAGVGLKMTFTLVNECYEPKMASQIISYLMLAFAITPGLSVALGGLLNTYYGWTSCFYAEAFYGFLLLLLVTRLPETQKTIDRNAFKIDHLIQGYASQFKNPKLILGGLLMGSSTCFVYLFAAVAPFVAITLFHLTSAQYGIANLLPPIGLILGSLVSAQLSKIYAFRSLIRSGIAIATLGVVLMFLAMLIKLPILFSLFFPMIIIYFGSSFILANASTFAMSQASDKAHGSAVMNFVNMGLPTVSVLSLGFFSITRLLLPISYLLLCTMMGIIFFAVRCNAD